MAFKAAYLFLAICTVSASIAREPSPGSPVTDDSIPFYDARLSSKPAVPSNVEIVLLARQALSVARLAFGNECEGDIVVKDIALGAFTRANAKQKAFLYRFCGTDYGFADNGIAIIEDGQLVSHIAYKAGSDSSIGALPDINGNGISEILLAGETMHQGYDSRWASIIEFTANGLRKLGRFETYEDDCGSAAKINKTVAFRLYAKRGPIPRFYEDTFVSSDCGETWQKKGARKLVVSGPGEDEVDYRRQR